MITGACRFAASVASLAAARLPIVIYHRVLPARDPLLPGVPDIDAFAQEIAWLRSTFEILPLHEAVALLYENRLPRRALCITFDDGYRDNVLHALPVLLEQGVNATFFITTAFMNGGMMWNDRVIESLRMLDAHAGTLDLTGFGLGRYPLERERHGVVHDVLSDLKYRAYAERESIADAILRAYRGVDAERLMMDAGEIRRLYDAGMAIGGHTHSHPILAQLDDDAAFEEIRANKSALEAIVGSPLPSFAYPNGRPGLDYGPAHARMVEQLGFTCAVSTSAGAASSRCDRFQIPRFTPWDRTQWKYCLRLIRNYYRAPVTAN